MLGEAGGPRLRGFLQWALPRLGLRWVGLRKVRRQVCRRITRRLDAFRLPDLGAYRDYLGAHPQGVRVLERPDADHDLAVLPRPRRFRQPCSALTSCYSRGGGMAKEIELRRHTDSEGDMLTRGGIEAALALGATLRGGHDVLVSSGAHRATQTLACLACALGERISGGAVVECGLRSKVRIGGGAPTS